MTNLADDRRIQAIERPDHALWTCYHAVYVMGILNAATLRAEHGSTAAVALGRSSRGACADLLSLLGADEPAPRWRRALSALSARRQDSLAPLLLAIVLRRARARGDLALVRTALQLALRHERHELGRAAQIQHAARVTQSNRKRPSSAVSSAGVWISDAQGAPAAGRVVALAPDARLTSCRASAT